MVAQPVYEKRQRTQIFVDIARNGVGGLHLDDSVVLARAGPMHQQIRFGLPAVLKVWVGSFIHFAIEPVHGVRR